MVWVTEPRFVKTTFSVDGVFTRRRMLFTVTSANPAFLATKR